MVPTSQAEKMRVTQTESECARIVELLLERLPGFIDNLARLQSHEAAEGLNPGFSQSRYAGSLWLSYGRVPL